MEDRKVKKGCGIKSREPSSEQSGFGGAECFWDEVSAYPSMKGEQYFEFNR